MLAERQKAREAEHAARKASKAEFAAEVKGRRRFGLRTRYAIKEARLEGRERLV